MSLFVKEHVTRVFRDAGYELLEIHGDRGGIVQGDGLHLVVQPDIAAAAARYTDDPEIISAIMSDAEASSPLRLSLYGGSSSPDREGVFLREWFIDFLKDETSAIYYRAQKEVNAIFEAEDTPDMEWDGRAYRGVVDEFPLEIEENAFRVFVRVYRVADQSFNPYESGDEEADREDAAAIIEGRASHGTVEVHVFEVDADDYIDGELVYQPFSAENFDGKDFEIGMAEKVLRGRGLIWTRDDNNAHTLELAAELFERDEEQAVADVLIKRAIERGLPVEADAAVAATRMP